MDDQTTKLHEIGVSKKHELSEDCWCEPYLDYKDDDCEIWIHRQIQ